VLMHHEADRDPMIVAHEFVSAAHAQGREEREREGREKRKLGGLRLLEIHKIEGVETGIGAGNTDSAQQTCLVGRKLYESECKVTESSEFADDF